jgi:hypothetical protein
VCLSSAHASLCCWHGAGCGCSDALIAAVALEICAGGVCSPCAVASVEQPICSDSNRGCGCACFCMSLRLLGPCWLCICCTIFLRKTLCECGSWECVVEGAPAATALHAVRRLWCYVFAVRAFASKGASLFSDACGAACADVLIDSHRVQSPEVLELLLGGTGVRGVTGLLSCIAAAGVTALRPPHLG